MDVEGSGDLADGFAFLDELPGDGALVGAQFRGAAEGDPTGLGGAPTLLGAGCDQ